MNIWLTYGIIAVILVIAELVYFRIADKCNIIDKPNERSSHSTIVLRGGGIVFAISMIVWTVLMVVQGSSISAFLPFLCGLVLICGISFWDDVHSLPDSVRLVVQFVATALMFWSIALGSDLVAGLPWYWVAVIGIVALVVFVGATDVINFMDGINGITAGYALAVLVPLVLLNGMPDQVGHDGAVVGHGVIAGSTGNLFIEPSYLIVAILGVLVFSFFNFRSKGKAKCFAGDVGSIGIAFIMLFAIGSLIAKTCDVTWLVFLLVYGVDGCCTIVHRFMLHERLGQAHRKHAYQILTNEVTELAFRNDNDPSTGSGQVNDNLLHLPSDTSHQKERTGEARLWRRLLGKAENSHVVVSLLYMCLQLVISLGFIYLCPNTVLAHWVYLVVAAAVLVVAYVLFMKKYYYLHEEYLAEQERKK